MTSEVFWLVLYVTTPGEKFEYSPERSWGRIITGDANVKVLEVVEQSLGKRGQVSKTMNVDLPENKQDSYNHLPYTHLVVLRHLLL